jgi:hypothetical protein
LPKAKHQQVLPVLVSPGTASVFITSVQERSNQLPKVDPLESLSWQVPLLRV